MKPGSELTLWERAEPRLHQSFSVEIQNVMDRRPQRSALVTAVKLSVGRGRGLESVQHLGGEPGDDVELLVGA